MNGTIKRFAVWRLDHRNYGLDRLYVGQSTSMDSATRRALEAADDCADTAVQVFDRAIGKAVVTVSVEDGVTTVVREWEHMSAEVDPVFVR